MDFGTWSPSHTILIIVVVVGFIGQIAVLFYRTAQLEKRMDKQNDDFQQQGQRLENRIDEVRTEIRSEISDLRNETRSEISDLRNEIGKLRIEFKSEISDVRTEISDVRAEISGVRAEISGVRDEMSVLNQNHIEHLRSHE